MSRYKAYPEYRDSGVEWLGQVPSHWKICRIKNTSTINPAKSEVRTLLAPETEVSFIPMEAIGENGELDITRTKPLSEVLSGYSYVADGDIMIAKITPCFENGKGAVAKALVNGIGFATTEVINIRPNNHEDSGYLFYLLSADPFRRLAEGSMYGAGGQKRVADSFVAEYHLSFPSGSERKKIATFLDHETARIDSLIGKQQRLIELLKEKRQAVISHAVTRGLNPNAPLKDSGVEWLGEVPAHWEMKKLKYLGDARNGLTYSPDDIVSEGEGTLVLRSSNVQNMRITFDDNVYVKKDIQSRIFTRLNDILICSRNGSRALIGKNALIGEEAVGMAYGAFMMVFRSQFNQYLFWVLNSQLFEYQSGSFLTSTINQLTVENINGFEIPLPPENERLDIIRHIKDKTSRIDELIDRALSSVAFIQERRTALISAAVTGKIDVRDWQAPA